MRASEAFALGMSLALGGLAFSRLRKGRLLLSNAGLTLASVSDTTYFTVRKKMSSNDFRIAPFIRENDTLIFKPGLNETLTVVATAGTFEGSSTPVATFPSHSADDEAQGWEKFVSAGPNKALALTLTKTLKANDPPKRIDIYVQGDQQPVLAYNQTFFFHVGSCTNCP